MAYTRPTLLYESRLDHDRQFSHTNGIRTLGEPLDRDAPNLAKYLQGQGYETAVIGKWHLKSQPSGFDYYNVLPNQGLYHNPKLKEKGDEWLDGGEGGKVYRGYVTDVITDLSLQWLDERDSSKPFFLMLHHKAPHGLCEPAERHKNTFADVKIPEPESSMSAVSWPYRCGDYRR